MTEQTSCGVSPGQKNVEEFVSQLLRIPCCPDHFIQENISVLSITVDGLLIVTGLDAIQGSVDNLVHESMDSVASLLEVVAATVEELELGQAASGAEVSLRIIKGSTKLLLL